jgi:hypothetical protein
MEAAAGTIYLRMKVVTTAGNISFVCATCGSVDGLEMFVMNWNPARFRLRVSSSNDDLDRSGVPDNTWFTYGVSWRTHADNDQAVSINETWTEGDNDHGTMGTAPSSFKVRTDTGEDVIVDAIVITNGWLDPVPAWW